eukprot:4624555-Alexandrium_andersonii.AAC.1
MVSDLLEEKKNKQGKGTKKYYVLGNPPRNFMKQISELCEAMRNWPKRCVILGADGNQWPFMLGVGHNTLKDHLGNIGSLLVQQ